jgi:dynactin complex subunit
MTLSCCLLSWIVSDWCEVGESVQVRPSNQTGVIAYVGTTAFAEGLWVGVELGECRSREGGEAVLAHINGSQHKEMFILADQ